MPRTVPFFVSAVVLLALWLAITLAGGGNEQWLPQTWPALLVFFVLVAAAERLHVRFRAHGQIEALNLSEAIIAPLLFAFSGPVAMGLVAGAQLAAGAIKGNEPIKVIFNSGQWALAAGVGSVVYDALRGSGEVSGHEIVPVALAMVAVGVVNRLALSTVVRLAQGSAPRLAVPALPMLVSWGAGWGLNTLVGLLFVYAYATSAWAVLLFWVPLVVLYVAYRGYAAMESDRNRLAGLHRASRRLAGADDADLVMPHFLAEMCKAFQSQQAQLWLRRDGVTFSYRLTGGDVRTYQKSVVGGTDPLVQLAFSVEATTRVQAREETEAARVLEQSGLCDALVTPLPEHPLAGVLAVFDQNGLEGFDEGEYAVLEALAREVAGTLEKGRLSAAFKQERGKLNRVVASTHDGMLSLGAFGEVRTWNSGLESILGQPAFSVVGRNLRQVVTLFDSSDAEVRLDNWAGRVQELPTEVRVLDRLGRPHFLECSYRTEQDDTGTDVLFVVAHDASGDKEIEQLREDVDRLAELEAAQRAKVLQLQDSLQPSMPKLEEAELGVCYEPSDLDAPTGGDYYDWQVLPDGDVHITVVDVLGHGIEATNDAFAVVHTLRTLAFQGVRVDDLIRQADVLLTSSNPELVATCLCIRYRPSTGECRVAGGGHPPVLLIHPDGQVDEVGAPGVPIGWPGAGSDRAVDLFLQPSDTLVLYTDGLIESQRDILRGLEVLVEHASDLRSLPADEVAGALVKRALEGADRRDDSLALVVRHRSRQVVSTPDGFGMRSLPVPKQVSVMRRAFAGWLSQQDLDEELMEDMTVAVTELASNAMKAARTYFEVRATTSGQEIVVEVEDDGPGFGNKAPVPVMPGTESESGRGLVMVRCLVDAFDVRTEGKGCTVRVRRRVTEPAGEAPIR